MWSRLSIMILGSWLMASPAVLWNQTADPLGWLIDVVGGAVAVVVASTRLGRRPPQLAAMMLMLGGALIAAAYVDFAQPTAGAQNRAIVGLLIAMWGLGPWSAAAESRRGSGNVQGALDLRNGRSYGSNSGQDMRSWISQRVHGHCRFRSVEREHWKCWRNSRL